MIRKKKRNRTDSASEQSRIMAAAFKDIKPQAHFNMRKIDMPFFNDIIAEQANAEWTNHTITLAALLAREMANWCQEQALLDQEGAILKTVKGYPFVNPRQCLLKMHTNNILALRRSLSIHARAQGVNKADMGRRTHNAKAIQDLALGFDDDLIARPHKTPDWQN